jgi:hypothetical protein
MSWTGTGGSVVNGVITGLGANAVIVTEGYYRETRTDPTNQDLTQGRFHLTRVTEFRGLDDTHSAALIGIYNVGVRVVTRTRNSIGAGGYNITQDLDDVVSSWFTVTEPT